MSDLNKDIDKLFTNSIEVHEMEPDEIVWSNIETKLEKKKNAELKRRISRLSLLLFSLGLVVIVLSLAIYNSDQGTKEKSFASTIVVTSDRVAGNHTKPSGSFPDSAISDADQNLNTGNNIQQNSGLTAYSENRNGNVVNVDNVNTRTTAIKQNKTTNSNSNFPKTKNTGNRDAQIDAPSQNEVSAAQVVDTTRDISSIDEKETPVFLQSLIINHLSITDTFTHLISSAPLNLANNNPVRQYSVTGFFTPEFVSAKLFDNDNNDSQNEGDFRSGEAADFSFTTGAKFGYQLNPKWNLTVGCTFSSVTFEIKPKMIYVKQVSPGNTDYSLTTTSGTVNFASPGSAQVGDSAQVHGNSFQQLRFIGIPLAAEYHFKRSRFDYFVYGGVSANFFLSGLTEVNLENSGIQSSNKIEGMNKYYLSGIGGFGVKYSMYKNFDLVLSPSFSRAITPLNSKTPVTSYPISFGLSAGVGFRF